MGTLPVAGGMWCPLDDARLVGALQSVSSTWMLMSHGALLPADFFFMVPTKPPNKADATAEGAEVVEGRERLA